MNPLSNMNRKLIYGLGIVMLFAAMFPYSNWLNAEKTRLDLGEATLGDVDTGSFMLKLALLGGARGVAANVLWTRALDLQKAQDWDRLKATVDLITKLQPHFLAVWTFQSWNLAYNVSVEWDAPEDKYHWIKEGINYVRDGVSKNRRSPDLVWDTAWYYYHKVGFSDESIIFRRLFRDDTDEDFKTDPIEQAVRNDNFQLARGWYTRAIDLVDEGEARVATGVEAPVTYVDAPVQRKGRPGDLAFRSMPAHAQTRYASSLEKASILGVPATFGEIAQNEWAKALGEWDKFGSYPFPSHNEIEVLGRIRVHHPIQINDILRFHELDALADDIEYWTEVTGIDGLTVEDCWKLTDNMKHWTERWGNQMNFPYWTDRSKAEMTSDGVRARQLFYEGTIAYKSADFQLAAEKFEQGLAIWDELLEEHPHYRNDDLNRKDTGLIVLRYERALRQLGQELPTDAPFQELLEIARQETSVDPFDALEVLPAGHTAEIGAY